MAGGLQARHYTNSVRHYIALYVTNQLVKFGKWHINPRTEPR